MGNGIGIGIGSAQSSTTKKRRPKRSPQVVEENRGRMPAPPGVASASASATTSPSVFTLETLRSNGHHGNGSATPPTTVSHYSSPSGAMHSESHSRSYSSFPTPATASKRFEYRERSSPSPSNEAMLSSVNGMIETIQSTLDNQHQTLEESKRVMSHFLLNMEKEEGNHLVLPPMS